MYFLHTNDLKRYFLKRKLSDLRKTTDTHYLYLNPSVYSYLLPVSNTSEKNRVEGYLKLNILAGLVFLYRPLFLQNVFGSTHFEISFV
jgi:hypothetical protein